MLKLTKDQKHNILEVMAAEMYKHKAYPSAQQVGVAADTLVRKHPCLKDKSERSQGYEDWQNSLNFKMGNYRHKLSRAGIKDVAVNAGKQDLSKGCSIQEQYQKTQKRGSQLPS